MTSHFSRVSTILLLVAAAASCSKSNPAQPTASSTATDSSVSTASVTIPRPQQPANAAQVKNAEQPITLTVLNAIVTKPGATTYTFEVATDAAFANKVQTKDSIAEGAGPQTSVKLDPLQPAQDYYWHARATAGGTAGLFSYTYKFSVGPAITVSAPVPIGPLNGAQTGPRPTFRVKNAARTGPAGPITYKFEVATSSAFSSIVLTGANTEGVNETGFIPTSNLPLDTTLYWRATASDAANGVTSAPSDVQSFTPHLPSQAEIVAEQLGVPLWPGVQPTGTVGHATMGAFWNVEYLVSFDGVVFLNPPLDELQIFDLMDRGMDPDAAIAWMNANGYPTKGVYYPSVRVIGFPYEYMAYINGRWDLVLRAGA